MIASGDGGGAVGEVVRVYGWWAQAAARIGPYLAKSEQLRAAAAAPV